MGENGTLEDNTEGENYSNKQVSLDTTIIELVDTIGWKGSSVKKGPLPSGVYFGFREIGKYVHTIGELKKLAENADGFYWLKDGVYFNGGKCLPYRALRSLGKKKLECLNNVLAEYGIEPIPWVTKKYSAWERQKERGKDWYEHLTI